MATSGDLIDLGNQSCMLRRMLMVVVGFLMFAMGDDEVGFSQTANATQIAEQSASVGA